MPARTGAEYIAGLQERAAEVYLHGEQVKDVTTHPALRNGVRTLARLYDMQHGPALRDAMTYVSPTTGERVGLSFLTPRTVQDLERRRTMMTHWARVSCGMTPAAPPLMVARNVFIRMYPRMAEILHLLGASSLMAIPTEADLQGPLAAEAAEIHSYLDTATASAEERIRLFRLAWDTCCSAFASRQVLYERYFGGDALRTAIILYGFYDRAPMMHWVREFLEQS